ncbi:MAG: hypothetical protein RL757_463 [Bacteroidota bacterium]|jgi:hypothetical protein
MNLKYTCPCCGYKTLDREDTFYDLCPVCFWETDPFQLANPDYKGGANRPSLQEAQQNFLIFGACEKDVFPYVRLPLENEKKDENFKILGNYTGGGLFFKRKWAETSGNPKTDDWGTSIYYFETDEKGEVSRQIIIYDNHRTLKYSELHLENEYGGLATEGLDLTDFEYIKIEEKEFLRHWNQPIIETFTAQKIHLAGWHIGVYDAEINTFKTKLEAQKTLISATLDHRFMLDLTFEKGGDHFPRYGFYLLKIREGHTGIHYFTYMNWAEAVAATQQWIDEINIVNKTVDVKKKEEEKAYPVRVRVDNQTVSATLTTWRNMDWEVEKFRNIQLEIGDEIYSVVDTFTDFENMLIAFQKSLPENYKLEICFFCRFSGYFVAGNDNFGDLDCFRKCKEKLAAANNKHKLIDLYESEKNNIEKVEETHYCSEFEAYRPTDWLYKKQE